MSLVLSSFDDVRQVGSVLALEVTMKLIRVLSVAVMSLSLVGCLASYGDADATLLEWNDRLSSELRPGASKADVEAFFIRHGLEHHFVAADRSYVAIDRDVEVNGLVSTSIEVACRLHSSDELAACTAAQVATGP